MSRNAPPGPSGARLGAGWAPRLRHFNTTGPDIGWAASRSPDTASSHSTARPESVAAKKPERRCTVTVNEKDSYKYSLDDVLLNLDIISEIKPGQKVSITVVKPESDKGSGAVGGSSKQQFAGDHGAAAKGSAREEGDPSKRRYVFYAKDMSKELKASHPNMELYVAKQMADNFGMKKGTQVVLAPVDDNNPAIEASHVEMTFRDQYLSRADMWRMTVNELTERTIYKGQTILFMGTIKAQVTAVFVEGRRVHSAFFSRTTRPIFRSESAKYVLFIQMSREMWDFDSDGSGEIMFNKVVNGFLPALFKKWVTLKVRHLVSIVLFARVEYDAGLSDAISSGVLTDYYTGSQPSGLKRPYKDFYRVVVNEMASVEWATILKQLKKEFNVFRRDISLHHHRPEANFLSVARDSKGNHVAPNRVKAISSLAMYGNLLEAVNLAASQYAHDYIDRDLMRTGISIVVISPGPGVFEVDYEALRRTTDSLVGNGIGIDLICVPKIPLHSVPLFKYRNPQYAEQPKDRWSHSRTTTPKHGSLVGSYRSLAGSLSPKGDLAHRADYFSADRTAEEWCYALPQWLHVSYWTGTSEDALSYQGIALSVNPGEDDSSEDFSVRCRMYDLQMRSVLETNEIETAPLMSDPLFPSGSIIENGGAQRPRHTGTDEIAHITNTKVAKGLHDHVYGFIKFAPDRTLKPGEKSLWKELQEYDNTRAKLPSSRRTHVHKSARDLDDNAKRQSLDGSALFGTSLPERKSGVKKSVSDNRKLSVNLGESGKVGRGLLSPGIPPSTPTVVTPPTHSTTSPTRPQRLMPHISLGQRGFGIAAPKAAVAEVQIETASASNSSRPRAPSTRSSETSSSHNSLNRRPASPRSIGKRPALFSPHPLRLDLPETTATTSSATGGIPSTPSIPIIKRPPFSSGPSDAIVPTKTEYTSPLARKGRRSEDRDVKFSSVLRAEDAQKVYNSKLRAGALPDLPSTLSPTTAISPWLTVLNPSNPEANKVDDTMLFSRWQHVFPRTSKMKVMKWKALCCPAAVPLTTEYFPSRTQFETEYESKPYNIAQNDDEDATEETKSREDFLRELISLRFAQGFQVIVGPAVARAFGQRLLKVADIFTRNQKLEDGASVFMSVGNTIHQLSCVHGSDVEVNIYSRKPPASSPEASLATPVYKPAIRTLLDSAYQTRELDIVSPRPERDWNYIDSYLAGHTDEMTENLRYWRARFVLIPVELHAAAMRKKPEDDNPEEIRIEGIREIAQLWQKNRYVPPSERRYQSISPRKRRDVNPLNIVYKTEDPSVVIAAELETLPLIEGLEGIPRKGQLLSGKERFRRDSLNPAAIAALADAIQQPVENGGVRVQNRRWHLRMHYNCFIGSDMTTWLLDNFEDLESREDAELLGKKLMVPVEEKPKDKDKDKEKEKEKGEGAKKERGSGLFVHVEKRHGFRDGQYFYQISEEYAKPTAPAGWFNSRKRDSAVPPTPLLDSVARDSPRMARAGSIQEDSPLGSAASTPTITPAGGKKKGGRPRVVLSKMIKYDVDPRKKSYRPERINLHYDRLHNPDACYHFRLEWMNVTAKLIEDAVEQWAKKATSSGLRLVEVPIDEACAITSMNPFKRPYLIHLAVPPPDTFPEEYPDSSTQEQRNRLFYQRAILRKFDFVLDSEAASNFPSDVDVSYSWGKPNFRYSQYIHRSGVLLAQITDSGDFLLMANSLCNNRTTYLREKEPKDPAPRYADTSVNGRVVPGSYIPEPAVPPGSPLSRSHVGSASPILRPTVSGNDYYTASKIVVADPEGIKAELEAFCKDGEGLEAFYRETLEKGAAAQTPGVAPGGESVGAGPGGLEVVPEANIPSLGLPPGVLRDGRERDGSPARGAFPPPGFPGQGLGVAAFRRRSVQDGIGLGGGLQK